MNLRRLDLNLLVVFDAVYSERSMTRAGLKIGLSQPAVSNALGRLRQVVGDELFLRGPKGLLPTRRAQAMAGPVHAILNELSSVLDDTPFDPGTAQEVISIAMVDFFEALLLPALMSYLDRNAPGIRLRLLPSFGRSYEFLDSGEADIAVASYTNPPDRFGHQTLLTSGYACAMRPAHPLASGPMTIGQFAQARHVLLSPKGDMRGFVDDELAKIGEARQVYLTVTGFLSAIEVLMQTDTIMTAPEPVIRKMVQNSGLLAVPCPVEPPPDHTRLDVIWHKRHFNHAMGRWFLNTLSIIASQLSNPNQSGGRTPPKL